MAKTRMIAKAEKVWVPAGVCERRDGSGETPLDAESIRQVVRGFELKCEIEERQRELEAINGRLVASFGDGANLIVPGVCRASIAERRTVRVEDAGRLQAVLGERYPHLVRIVTAVKPDQKLVEMATDADHPLAAALRECLSVNRSSIVTWRAEK